jgi:hypothetical protein
MKKCQLCKIKEATVDGKTKTGPWAYMCYTCHRIYGMGLGPGRGQLLKGAAK